MSLSISIKVAVICVVGLLAMPMAHALSLGEIKLHSALYDPLDAEIMVHSTDAAEILNARVQLASHDVHNKAGLRINRHMRRMTFKTVAREKGKFAIQLRTLRPISEPILEFIIEISGGGTNLLRSYAIHLDPPK